MTSSTSSRRSADPPADRADPSHGHTRSGSQYLTDRQKRRAIASASRRDSTTSTARGATASGKTDTSSRATTSRGATISHKTGTPLAAGRVSNATATSRAASTSGNQPRSTGSSNRASESQQRGTSQPSVRSSRPARTVSGAAASSSGNAAISNHSSKAPDDGTNTRPVSAPLSQVLIHRANSGSSSVHQAASQGSRRSSYHTGRSTSSPGHPSVAASASINERSATLTAVNSMLDKRLDGLQADIVSSVISALNQANIKDASSAKNDGSALCSFADASILSDNSTVGHGTKASSHKSEPQRIPVDISLRHISIYGEEYQTSPVMFAVGDRPLWLYSKNILLPVEILEATPPARWRRQPTYHAKFAAGEGTRVGRHDIHHDDLFLPLDKDDIFGPSGRLDANLDDLRISDRLDAHAMPDTNPLLIQRWGGMDMASYKTKDFIASIKDESLSGDSLTALEHFYSSVQIFLQSSHKANIDILPDLSELSPTTSLRDCILPPPSYSHFARAKSCYDSIGRILHMTLHRPEFTSKAPLAREVLSRVLGGTTDGWDILHELLKGRLPYLGATDFDVTSVISTIKASNGMLFSDFIYSTQQAQRTIHVSGLSTLPNALLKQFLQELMRCDNLSPLIASKNQHFHEFLRSTGNKEIYTAETIDSLIRFLNLGRPPLRLTVSVDSSQSSPLETPRMASYGGQRSILPYNRPSLAAMATQPDVTPPPPDDATVDQPSPDESVPPHPTLDMDDLASSVVKPVLASLNISVDNKDVDQLLMAAMKRFSAKRKRCECCEGGAHTADRCYARGPEFQPPHIRRAVKQYNLKHGTTPKIPFDKDNLPTPKSATFAPGLTHSSMCLPCTPDADDSEVLHLSLPAEASQPSADSNLQLRSISTAPAVDAIVNELSRDLDASIETGSISYAPQLAVMDLPSTPSDAQPSEPPSSMPHGIAQPLVLADYSPHGDQVNC